MTEPEDYTVELFLDEIEAIIKKNPDNINPSSVIDSGYEYTGCVYRNPNGDYCLIGQWLYEKHPVIFKKMEDSSYRKGWVSSLNEEDGIKIFTSAWEILENQGFTEPVSKTSQFCQDLADKQFRNIDNELTRSRWEDLLSEINELRKDANAN